MGERRGWLFNDLGEERVVDVRELVLAGMVVYGRFESTNVGALSHPSAKPVIVAIDDREILFSEVVSVVPCVLKDRRLKFTAKTGGGGKGFLPAGG